MSDQANRVSEGLMRNAKDLSRLMRSIARVTGENPRLTLTIQHSALGGNETVECTVDLVENNTPETALFVLNTTLSLQLHRFYDWLYAEIEQHFGDQEFIENLMGADYVAELRARSERGKTNVPTRQGLCAVHPYFGPASASVDMSQMQGARRR